jgi:hypothetical protein
VTGGAVVGAGAVVAGAVVRAGPDRSPLDVEPHAATTMTPPAANLRNVEPVMPPFNIAEPSK